MVETLLNAQITLETFRYLSVSGGILGEHGIPLLGLPLSVSLDGGLHHWLCTLQHSPAEASNTSIR